MEQKLLLIDGNSILNRAFYGLPDMTNSQGLHTNAVLGFLNIMFKFLEEENPTHLAVAFDLKAPTFRHKMFADYKGTRKGMPDELREQVPVIREVLQAMNIPLMMKEGYEAAFAESTVTITLKGLRNDLDKLMADSIKGNVNAAGLAEGNHTVTVTLELDDSLYSVNGTQTAVITITKKSEDTSDTTNTGNDNGTHTGSNGGTETGTGSTNGNNTNNGNSEED